MLENLIVYLGLLCYGIIMADKAQKTSNKKYILSIVVIFTLVAGLRAPSVGIDTKNYIYAFEMISSGKDYVIYFEESFKIICVFLLAVCNHPNFLLIVFSFITNSFIIYRIWDFKNNISFKYAIAMYYISMYIGTFNTMRQCVSVALVFWGTRYIEKNQYWKFFIYVLLAFMFHKSALISVIFILFDMIRWKSFSNKYKIFFLLCIACFPAIGTFLLSYMLKYSHYFEKITLDLGFMVVAKLTIFVASLLLYKSSNGLKIYESEFKGEEYGHKIICIYAFFSICLSGLTYVFRHMGRISYYFLLFEIIFFSRAILCNSKIERMFIKIAIFVIYGYSLIVLLTQNSQGHLPYLFFWQV